MAAWIDQTTGRAAMFVAGEPPWHGLGTVVANALSSAEAIVLADLDWTVEKWQLRAAIPNRDATLRVPGWYATVRGDTHGVLGVVSERYVPLQNKEAFAFMDEIVGSQEAMWETAGSLNGGKRVWMLARLPQTVAVAKDDEVKPYALICNGHDGSLAVHVLPTTVRVVCNNTLNLALKDAETTGQQLVIRHSESLQSKVELARRQLGIITSRIDAFAQQAQALAQVEVTGQQAARYFEQFFPTRKRPDFSDGAALLERIVSHQQQSSDVVRDLLAGHYAETERIAKRNAGILEQVLDNFESHPARGTAWGAYNAVSEYADHQQKFRSADSRLNSAWFGSGNEVVVSPRMGATQAFILQTFRQREVGDTIFLQYVDGEGRSRTPIPPAAAEAIPRQRHALTTKSRQRLAQARTQARKARGEWPGLLKYNANKS